MPIYAYRCAACGHAKDVLQKLSDPLLSVCPACGADAFRKQLTAEAGQVVVAMIDGEATVKRYYPEGDRIRFQPANPTMRPIVVARSEFRSVDLLGVVIGVYRKLS